VTTSPRIDAAVNNGFITLVIYTTVGGIDYPFKTDKLDDNVNNPSGAQNTDSDGDGPLESDKIDNYDDSTPEAQNVDFTADNINGSMMVTSAPPQKQMTLTLLIVTSTPLQKQMI
jgi:hypothetical protein